MACQVLLKRKRLQKVGDLVKHLIAMIRRAILRYFSENAKRGGSLYTWGETGDSLGYFSSLNLPTASKSAPKKVEGDFDGKVIDCYLSKSHGALVTST